ncbi:MAG: PAS domain S-box protein [Bacteroidota bacterium]
MKELTHKKLIEKAPFGYAVHKIILDKTGKAIDYEFIEVNEAFEKLTGHKSSEIINRKITEVQPDIKDGDFDWIACYGTVALEGIEKEFEQYSKPLKKWYKVYAFSPEKNYFVTYFSDISTEKLISNTSKYFLDSPDDKPQYQSICDDLLSVSNAKYVALNIIDNYKFEFTTQAVAGIGKHFKKAAKILGFDILGKKWKLDAARNEKIKDKTITRFKNLHDLAAGVISDRTMILIEKTFNIGEIAIVKIMKDNQMLGDFTIIMRKGDTLKNDTLWEIFAKQIGLFIEYEKAKNALKDFFDVNPELFFIANMNGDFLRVNKQWEKTFGYTVDEILNTKNLELVHPEDKEATIDQILKVLESKDIASFTNRNRCKNGKYRYIEWKAFKRDNLICGAGRDITDKKNLEALNQTLLSSLQHPAMYIRAKDRVVLAANKIALDFGVKIGGQCWKEFGKSDYISKDHKEIAEKFPDFVPPEYGIKCSFCQGDACMSKDPEQNNPEVEAFGLIWDTYWIKISDEVYLHYVANITERKEAEEKIEQSEANLNAIIESTNNSICSRDKNAKLIAYNKAFEVLCKELFNIDIKPGMNTMDYLSPDKKMYWKLIIKEVLKGNFHQEEIAHKFINGEERHYSISFNPIKKGNKITGFVEFTSDITNQKKAIQALRESEKKLKEAQKIAHIGHWELDLNTNKLSWSDEIYRIFNTYPNQFRVGCDAFLEFVHPDDRTYVSDTYKKHSKLKLPYSIIYRIVLPNGWVKYVNEKCKTEFDETGKAIRSMGTIADISNQVLLTNKLKKAKEKAEENEEKYRSLINQSMEMIVLHDMEGNIKEVNNAIIEQSGFSKKELLKLKTFDIEYNSINSNERIKQWKSWPLGNVVTEETKIKTKNGYIFPVEVCSGKITYGNKVYILSLVRDITERQIAEESIQKLFKGIEQSPASVLITDTNGRIEYSNKKFEELTGYKFEEIIGENPRILKSGKQDREFYKNLWETITAGNDWRGEMVNKKKDGTYYTESALISPIKNENDEIINFIAIKEDITRLKKTEQALRESEEKHRYLIENTDNVYWKFDLINNKWDYVAPQSERILGYKPEEWTDYDFWLSKIHEDDREWAANYCLECTQKGMDHSFEYRFRRKDGNYVWLRDEVKVELKDGMAVELWGIMKDITLLKQIENIKETLQQSEKLAYIGTLSSGIAHEVNNSLAGIINCAERIAKHPDEVKNNEKYIDLIKYSSRQLKDFTQQLLNFARIPKTDYRTIKLSRILETPLLLTSGRIEKNNIKIENNLDKNVLINANKNQLEHVFINLIINSIDAIKEHKIINKNLNGNITIDNYIENHFVIITFKDNGIGIDAKELKKVFNLFFTNKSGEKGSGLGIPISNSIIKKHGGNMEIESKPKKGTSIRISLPLYEKKPDNE